MLGRKTIAWIIAAAVALPLLLCSPAQAESGCHRGDSGPPVDVVVSRGGSSTG
ncbi:MAG: hypothetical protein HQ546_03135 [Planctomycetes bacterium]|nr:hypothetical protein [Planctomycetota bacterium]